MRDAGRKPADPKLGLMAASLSPGSGRRQLIAHSRGGAWRAALRSSILLIEFGLNGRPYSLTACVLQRGADAAKGHALARLWARAMQTLG